jgi:hypothetical protein
VTSNKDSIIQSKFNGDEEAYKAWLKANATLGGRVKGKKGFATLSKAERAQKAREGAVARWKNKPNKT